LRPLFVYGTLRDPDILTGVLGRPLAPDSLLSATAPGFRAVPYPGRVYPALIRSPGAAAQGLVALGLTSFEHDLLDAFEGDEYRRDRIAVMIAEELHEADAYLPDVSVSQDAPDWTLAHWQAEHKAKVLAGERATANELRLKLLAIRPN
jgi:hypothetical protein